VYTDTHCAVTLLVMLVVDPMFAEALVFEATGQAPITGVLAVVTGTVIVHVVAGFTIWRLATVIVLEFAAAVTLPPVHVPPAAPPVATSPAGNVSVKEKVCVGLFAGTVSVNVSVVVPPEAMEVGANAFVSTGTE
jgi:hypothetical protein